VNTPTIVDGAVYITGPDGTLSVYSVDATQGAEAASAGSVGAAWFYGIAAIVGVAVLGWIVVRRRRLA
jgi:hypothetical protein